jgi:membrane protein required for colicin V production
MSALQDLTGLDWIVLAILVVSMIGSFIRGFAREMISLSAVVVGLVLACWFYPEVGSYFLPYVKTQDIASFCGFVIIFVLTLLVGGVISFMVRNFLRFVDLSGSIEFWD